MKRRVQLVHDIEDEVVLGERLPIQIFGYVYQACYAVEPERLTPDNFFAGVDGYEVSLFGVWRKLYQTRESKVAKFNMKKGRWSTDGGLASDAAIITPGGLAYVVVMTVRPTQLVDLWRLRPAEFRDEREICTHCGQRIGA